jgi:hypothetical protein
MQENENSFALNNCGIKHKYEICNSAKGLLALHGLGNLLLLVVCDSRGLCIVYVIVKRPERIGH